MKKHGVSEKGYIKKEGTGKTQLSRGIRKKNRSSYDKLAKMNGEKKREGGGGEKVYKNNLQKIQFHDGKMGGVKGGPKSRTVKTYGVEAIGH